MNLYVIGPVTGMPDFNRAAFAEARARLTAAGYNARIPHDFIPPTATHEQAMRMSLRNLLDNADGIALLDGWYESRGATVEVNVAAACGITCKLVDLWIDDEEEG